MLYIDIKKHLKNFTLDIALETTNNRVGILGKSGSGKSMMLKAIAGIIKPDNGIIVLNDKVLFDSKKKINLPSRQRNIGYLFQNYALFPHMTVRENIVSGMLKNSKDKKQEVCNEMIKKLCLEGLENRYPKELSGGQQQRVAIARMLAKKPNIFMFDEPFSALDYHLREHMQENLLEILNKENTTSLLVSHDIDEAYRLSKEIVVIDNGKIKRKDRKEEIFKNPENLTTAKITGCKNLSRVKKIACNKVFAIDWGVEVEIFPTKNHIDYIGIRAHHIEHSEILGENIYPYIIESQSETRFGQTMYFSLGKEHREKEKQLRFEVDKKLLEKEFLKGGFKYIKLPKESIILLKD
ncbi:MAG: ATP-binding cassette domain-containing protein [Clostridium perfringens]|nr:ATP-binding cassette domain-containing protein [Clostridium perfringens]